MNRTCMLVLGLSLVAQEREDDLLIWQSYILPKAEELAWQKIPWRSSLGAAVGEAHSKDQPILLWAMNGHPLACT